jgi:hypothetical protein
MQSTPLYRKFKRASEIFLRFALSLPGQTRPMAALCLVVLFASCARWDGGHKPTEAEKLWIKVEYQDRTNRMDVAYDLSVEARDRLETLSKTSPRDLDYPYCLAFLNARLYLMARALRDTNAAHDFFLQSGYYFNENRKQMHMPTTNFSPETIEYYVKVRDAKVHPAQTNGVP